MYIESMDGKQIYVRSEDYERLKQWADAEKRSLASQFSVVLDAYNAHRPSLKVTRREKRAERRLKR